MSDGRVVIEIELDDNADKQIGKMEKDLNKAGESAGKSLEKAYNEAVKDIANTSNRLKNSFIGAFKAMGSIGGKALKSSFNFIKQMPATVGSGLKVLASTVKTGFVNANKAAIASIKKLGTSIKNTSVNIKNGFFSVAKAVQSGVKTAVAASIQTIKAIPSTVKSAGALIKSSFISAFQISKQAAISFSKSVAQTIKAIPKAIKTVGSAIKSGLVIAFKASVVAVHASVKGIISTIKGIPAAVKFVGGTVKSGFSLMANAAKTTGSTIKTALIMGFNEAKSGAKTAGQVGMSAIKMLGNAAKSAGIAVKNGLVGGFKAASATAKGAFSGMRESFKQSVEQPAQQARVSILRLAAAFGLIAATKNVIGSAIGRVDTIDTATKSLKVLTGSAKDAELIMNDLTDAIDGTPIALDAVALGAKKMVAAGMQAKSVKPVFTAIADAAYGVGDGAPSIDQMVDAISSLQASSIAYSDDINRLVDSGVPAWQILANQTGKSVGDMKKDVSKGMLDSNKAIKLLVDGIENGTTGIAGNTAKMAGLAKTAGNTISGSFANMKTAAVKSMANIATNLKGPIIASLTYLKNAFKDLATYTASPEFQAKLTNFVKKMKEIIPVALKLAPTILKLVAAFAAFNVLSSVFSKVASLVGAFKGLASSGGLLGTILSGIKGGFTALSGAIGSSAGAFALIGAAVAAVIAVFVGMYKSFKENTANIRNVMAGIWEAVKNSFGKTIEVFKQILTALKPVGSAFGGILKYIGVAVWVAFGSALAIVADVLQILARVTLVVIKALQGVYYAVKAAAQAIKGDFKGAKKSIEQSKDAFVDAGQAIKDAFNKDNYATTGVIKSFGDLGKASESAGKKVATSNKEIQSSLKLVSATTKQTENTVSKANNSIDSLLNSSNSKIGGKLNEKTKSFLTAVKKTYDSYQKASQASADKYTSAMEKAEDLSGAKRKAAIAKANTDLVKETQSNNEKLLMIRSDYGKLLSENKWVNGQQLTDEQKKSLKQQTADIDTELAKQNELYVKANLMRLQNGKTLSDQERSTSLEVQNGLYDSRAKAVENGENKLLSLKKKKGEATTKNEKAQFQIQIDKQKETNKQLKSSLQNWSSETNSLIANGSTLNATTFANGLKLMKDLSAPQLTALWYDFAQTSTSIDNTLSGLAAIMGQRGGQGVQSFVQAIQSGDYIGAASKINNDVISTIKGLPNEMFANGQTGKTKFLKAIKSGDFKGAGNYLRTGVKDGMAPLSKDASAKGKQTGDNLKSGMNSKGPEVARAGLGLSNSAIGGIDTSGAESKGNDFGQGFANGISAMVGVVGQAAGAIVATALAATQKKQDSHSPSKKTKKLGKDYGSGFSLGIASKEKAVKKAASSLVEGALGTQKQIKRLSSTLKDKISTAVTTGLHTKSMTKSQRNRINALKGIDSTIAKQTTNLAKVAKKRDKVVEQLKKSQKKLADIQKSAKDYAASIRDNALSFGSITSMDKAKLSGTDIIKGLDVRYKAIKSFQQNVAKLRKKGLSNQIIQQILDAGVEDGSAYAKALAKSNTKTIKAINKKQKSISSASKSLGNTAYNSMYQSGIYAAKGLVKGLDSQKKALDKSAKRIANTISKSVRKALKIHSPSRIAVEIGKFFGVGLGNGIDRTSKYNAVKATNLGNTVSQSTAKAIKTPNIKMPSLTKGNVLGVKTASPNRVQKNINQNTTNNMFDDSGIIKAIKSSKGPVIVNVGTDKIVKQVNEKNANKYSSDWYMQGGGALV